MSNWVKYLSRGLKYFRCMTAVMDTESAGMWCKRFMDNLQTEVLEMEFNEFAHGSATIHEQDFARILLRYTTLTKQAHAQYLDRLARRIPHSQVLQSPLRYSLLHSAQCCTVHPVFQYRVPDADVTVSSVTETRLDATYQRLSPICLCNFVYIRFSHFLKVSYFP